MKLSFYDEKITIRKNAVNLRQKYFKKGLKIRINLSGAIAMDDNLSDECTDGIQRLNPINDQKEGQI